MSGEEELRARVAALESEVQDLRTEWRRALEVTQGLSARVEGLVDIVARLDARITSRPAGFDSGRILE